ncbi:hypothetical protein BDZ90DRAFT_233880 [Jaminaea rosea]|uniref:Uncharacterized protein n=1 Tax=Jaminaea rosea TaxID=1569628 RepID=A0A316UKT7_9BASI|nr:hypothetical protein BDZ90DRAFT_233880 [Jaminaea rosea]PWN25867.1 hypothetical protein BDZ90DRAFT_233880 [Jaminaea rosea]
MRNYCYTRWDQCRYSLVEKGTSVQYGDFQWSEACSIRLREGIPPDLDHSMIIFALVTLLLMQFDMSTGFTPQDFCPTDGTDTTVHRFNGAALRKLAAEYGIRR